MAVPVLTCRSAGLCAALAFAACASNHRVSPLPDVDAITLAPRDDLATQLARIDAETAAAGLTQTDELRGRLADGRPVVVRGYRGTDALGRPVHATRVATPSGVVLALGPADAMDRDPHAAELVPSLEQGAYASGTDLDGDGAPEVALRDALGALVLYRLDRFGAARVPVELARPPTWAFDADGDGHPDLAARVGAEPGDPIAPDLVDVATPADGRWTHAAPAARAWHARARDEAAARYAAAVRRDDDAGPAPLDDGAKLAGARAALERAFHALAAGDGTKRVRAALDASEAELGALPAAARAAWAAWRRRTEGPAP